MEPDFQFPASIFSSDGRIASMFEPISSLVPSSTVSGRSVLFRKVMQGMPKTVASSVIPPESVMMPLARSTK